MPTMEALRYHTYDGVAHDEGDRYEADDAYVETLEAVQFARRVAAPEAKHEAPHESKAKTHPHAPPKR